MAAVCWSPKADMKDAPNGWLKAAEIYSLSVLEVSGPQSRC